MGCLGKLPPIGWLGKFPPIGPICGLKPIIGLGILFIPGWIRTWGWTPGPIGIGLNPGFMPPNVYGGGGPK